MKLRACQALLQSRDQQPAAARRAFFEPPQLHDSSALVYLMRAGSGVAIFDWMLMLPGRRFERSAAALQGSSAPVSSCGAGGAMRPRRWARDWGWPVSRAA